MKYSFLGFLFLISSTFAVAQQIKLINSGEVIEQSRILKDSSKFEESIKLLLTIPKRDTNYVFMLSELAQLYNSNKQYDKALETANEVLKKFTAYEIDIMRVKGVALFNLNEFDSSVTYLEKEIEKRPFEYRLLYALGTIYYDHKDYEKAADYFFRVLSFYPFHAGSHLNLGRIGMLSGRKSHAMMAFGMYLSINNNDNPRLVLLNNFLSNQITDDGSLKLSSPNGFEKLDQIIRSKIALDESFKTSVQFKVAVVNQYEMFFSQLGTVKANSDDRWMKHYLPVYTAIKEQNLIEPFIYHIVKSSDKEEVKKWLNKNEKTLNTFFANINTVLKKNRETLNITGFYGFTSSMPAWYDNKNLLTSFGKKQNDQPEGRWVYLDDMSTVKAEGDYTQGKKKGTWKYYHSNSKVRSVENYETGEITIYREDGSKMEHFYLKDDLTEGKVEVFHASGASSDIMVYKKGERDGKGEAYYATGTKQLSYEYTAGKPTGRWVNYSPAGQITKIRNIKSGNLHGEFIENYSTGKLKISGSYLEGEETGTWKYYYANGQLEKSGEYKNGISVGEWTFYNKVGNVSTKGVFNEKGEWNGVKTNYHDNKPRSIYTYKDGVIVKVVHFDWNGKEIGNFGDPKGVFKGKIFYLSGQLNGEGTYKNGEVHGKWTYYYPEGSKFSEFTYEEGQTNGEVVEYYRTGAKRYAVEYKDDELHGYFREFHQNGNIKAEGWYQNGLRQQQWLTYYPDGKIESDYYYLNNQILGEAYDYNTDGKKYMMTTYDINSKVIDYNRYDQAGIPTVKSRTEKGLAIYESFFSSGKPNYKSSVLNGVYSGAITQWLPDGSVHYAFSFSEGDRNDVYKTYYANGQIETEGFYVDGSREQKWNFYYGNGIMDNTGIYINGGRDSIWTYFYPSGSVYSTNHYEDDNRDGITRYYSPEGANLLEKFYENNRLLGYRVAAHNGQFGEWKLLTGNETIIAKHPNGEIAYEEPYKKGLLTGIKRVNYASGKPCFEYVMKDGDYSGSYKSYYRNGNIFQKKEYIDNEVNGIVETYASDGKLLFTETFLNGLSNGKAVIYKQGVKQKEFNFWAGLPDQ